MRRVFLCTSNLYRLNSSVRWANIDDRGWVNGETPVEDFGMWFLVDHEISEESASRIFLALIGRQEGEEPVVGSLSNDERLRRSHLLPTLLEPAEFEIYTSLIADGNEEVAVTPFEQPAKRDRYEVVVGNLGYVHTGNNQKAALRCYREYVTISKAGVGKVGNEQVTLFRDGEILKEHDAPMLTLTE